jgi:hypothetical protein
MHVWQFAGALRNADYCCRWQHVVVQGTVGWQGPTYLFVTIHALASTHAMVGWQGPCMSLMLECVGQARL